MQKEMQILEQTMSDSTVDIGHMNGLNSHRMFSSKDCRVQCEVEMAWQRIHNVV